MPLNLGVSLPTFAADAGSLPDIPALARHAEQVGLDATWAGDHLSTGAPFLESTVALASAAAVTSRLQLGFGVLLLALRQQAWVAKQLSTLQFLSGNRVLLGVGAGGEPAAEWRAAGVPFDARGGRTDSMLRALPDLLRGKPTRLHTEPGGPWVTLEPAVVPPPVWIGGMSDRALRRTVEFGSGWLSSLLRPKEFGERADALSAMAAEVGKPAPATGTTVFAALGSGKGERERVAGFLRHLTGNDSLSDLVVAGPPAALAEWLEQYRQAGASTFVVNLSGPELHRQYELLGEVRELLVSG